MCTRQVLSLLVVLACVVYNSITICASIDKIQSPSAMCADVGIFGYQDEYNDDGGRRSIHLSYDNAESFTFKRFQSPISIHKSLSGVSKPFKFYQGNDGRRGEVSATKLDGDWVLARSRQVAEDCTTQQVLQAYLSGNLQETWNAKDILQCSFMKKEEEEKTIDVNNIVSTGILKRPFTKKQQSSSQPDHSSYYQQYLVLKSQRVITSKTGIMRYSQIITIDQIGNDDYSVLVRLHDVNDDNVQTSKKPFDALSVQIGLEQDGKSVNIYANGIMKVNRKVVPNLIVFDASGIAGSMAGKGTLWMAAYFQELLQKKKQNVLDGRKSSTAVVASISPSINCRGYVFQQNHRLLSMGKKAAAVDSSRRWRNILLQRTLLPMSRNWKISCRVDKRVCPDHIVNLL